MKQPHDDKDNQDLTIGSQIIPTPNNTAPNNTAGHHCDTQRRRFMRYSVKGAAAFMASLHASYSFAQNSSSPTDLAAQKKSLQQTQYNKVAPNQTKKKVGVALVGLGYYSTDILAPAFEHAEHCELRGIVTGSPEKIPAWQKRYGIPDKNIYNYSNMHEVAANPDIDVLYIVLPTFLHKKYSIIAANAGKHVWCEKPMAMSVEECQAVIDACRKNKVKLSIGYRMQHEPNTKTIIAFAHQQPYGAIKSVISEAGYNGNGFAPDNWKMHQSKGGGATYDMGVYPINAARYATGLEPIAVTAQYINPQPQKFKHTDPASRFTLEFPNNIKAQCQASTIDFINHLKVNCEQGWYELKPMQTYSGVKGQTSDGNKLDLPIKNQQAKQMDNDSLSILNNTQVLVPGIEGLKDIRIVQAIHASAKNNGQRIVISS